MCEFTSRFFFHSLEKKKFTYIKQLHFYNIISKTKPIGPAFVGKKVFFFSNIESCAIIWQNTIAVGTLGIEINFLKGNILFGLVCYTFTRLVFQLFKFNRWERQKGLLFMQKKVLKIEFSLSSIPLFHILFLSGWISIWK